MATTAARWTAALGLVCGVLYSGIGMVLDLRAGGWNGGTTLAFLAIVVMPLLFGAAGFVGGALGALVVTGFGGAAEPAD